MLLQSTHGTHSCLRYTGESTDTGQITTGGSTTSPLSRRRLAVQAFVHSVLSCAGRALQAAATAATVVGHAMQLGLGYMYMYPKLEQKEAIWLLVSPPDDGPELLFPPDDGLAQAPAHAPA